MTIRLADCVGQRNRANMLLERMYSWRGYGTNHKLPAAPNCVTFTATSQEDVIGTLTLTVDSTSRPCRRSYIQRRTRALPDRARCEAM